MAESTIDRVRKVIAETQRIPLETVQPDSTFDDLKIDSLDGINILFGLENEFNVNIPDDAAKGLRSVRDLADGLDRLLAGEGETGAAVA